MMHFAADGAFAVFALIAYIGGIWASAILGAIVFVCLIGALILYEDKFDPFDKLALSGLAGSLILTTPALFLNLPELNGWSFNLSRAFLAIIAVRRFGVPVAWAIIGGRRQRAQIVASASRTGLRDNMDGRL